MAVGPWAHRNWAATPLVLICARGRKNVIYQCESVVPPTQTQPHLSRLFEIPRRAWTAFTEEVGHQDGPCRLRDPAQSENAPPTLVRKIKNFRAATGAWWWWEASKCEALYQHTSCRLLRQPCVPHAHHLLPHCPAPEIKTATPPGY